jgi:hypothetical protein
MSSAAPVHVGALSEESGPWKEYATSLQGVTSGMSKGMLAYGATHVSDTYLFFSAIKNSAILPRYLDRGIRCQSSTAEVGSQPVPIRRLNLRT